MIILEGVTKVSKFAGERRTVLASVNLTLPSDRRIALLGPSDEEKRTVIATLAGTVMVTAGRIVRKARLSFPVGDLPGFEPYMPLRINISYVARLYGIDARRLVDFVTDILDIGDRIDKPYNEFPMPMRRPLAQVIALGLPFDTYLLVEDKMRGDEDLRKKCWALLEARARTCGLIVPTNDPKFAHAYCDMALVLHSGRAVLLNAVDEGLAVASALP